MPAELTLYGRPVDTVFDLLGTKENDITYSLGWALAESERLSSATLADMVPGVQGELIIDSVRLQEGVSGAGFTDIEIFAGEGDVHVVIEAKRGYDLPPLKQLQKYATRTQPPPRVLVVCAEASADFVAGKLPDTVAGIPVCYRSWQEIEALVSAAASDTPPRREATSSRPVALSERCDDHAGRQLEPCLHRQPRQGDRGHRDQLPRRCRRSRHLLLPGRRR